MNERLRELVRQAGLDDADFPIEDWDNVPLAKYTELIVKECVDICMGMAAKCAGLEGDGALAKDCAYWIKKDFGVEE